ncbi:hypothetical protein FQR65_LT05036 [Abscondita terminalis]|nr:hypothetical protein FQR65_LT05036 [Abscondita terminalis]
MLRTRRRDNNVKPNRRLDRKSSRGMLYENEELRLKTININAEVERGQSDIKKLKRENDQLRREIWYLRDEYDKLDKLLREKGSLCSSSSTTCSSDSESCSSNSEETEAVETCQNIENVNKTTHLKKLNDDFDHLSVVQEENSGENSEKNSNRDSWIANIENDVIKADQSYPSYESKTSPKHFFSPIKVGGKPNDDYVNNQFLGPDLPYADGTYTPEIYYEKGFAPYCADVTVPGLEKTTTDVIVKTDNQNFNTINSHSTFSNGGNLEELLNDIETISHDILTISNSQSQMYPHPKELGYLPAPRVDNYEFVSENGTLKPYKSELNVVLMPAPMKLIEIEKYKNIQKSCESINNRSAENLTSSVDNLKLITDIPTPGLIIPPDQFCATPFVPVPPNCPEPTTRRDRSNPFFFGNLPNVNEFSDDVVWMPGSKKSKEAEIYSSKANLLDTAVSSDHVSSENEENLKFKAVAEPEPAKVPEPETKKTSLRRRVSIHFKGKKDKSKKDSSLNLKIPTDGKEKRALHKTPSVESKISTTPNEPKTPTSGESKTSNSETKNCESRKSSSASPERKHGMKETKKIHKRHKKPDRSKAHRGSIGTERFHRERSYSVCTDRSNILDHRLGFCSVYDDFTTSDRERTNSLSSCDTLKGRKLSVSHFPTGKIPWCGCWGNGCL